MSYGEVRRYKDPEVTKISDGILIKHREYIQQLKAVVNVEGGTIPVSTHIINPGHASIFSWLRDIALNFERYRFRKLVFHYRPLCATTTTGEVMMNVDHDVYDPVPTSRASFFAAQGSVCTPLWKEVRMSVPPRLLKDYRYVSSTGTSTSGQDAKTLHVGRFQWLTSNVIEEWVRGDFFVEYEVELIIPQSNVIPQALGHSQHFKTDGTGATTSSFFGTPAGVTTDSGARIFEVNSTGTTMRFPGGGSFVQTILSNNATGIRPVLEPGLDAKVTLLKDVVSAATGINQSTWQVDVAKGAEILVNAGGLTAPGIVEVITAAAKLAAA
jgi:hypothetical protein